MKSGLWMLTNSDSEADSKLCEIRPDAALTFSLSSSGQALLRGANSPIRTLHFEMWTEIARTGEIPLDCIARSSKGIADVMLSRFYDLGSGLDCASFCILRGVVMVE